MRPNKFYRNVGLCLCCLLCVILAACQPVSNTEIPQPTPTATQTPIPTATIDWFPPTLTPTLKYATVTPDPLSSLTPPPTGKVLFEDEFLDQSFWEVSSSQAGNIAFGENYLSLAVAGNQASLTSLSSYSLPSEFYLELSAEVTMCSPDDTYNIIFWHFSEMGTYQVRYSCSGEMRVERTIYDSTSVLQTWVQARRFQPDSPAKNRLGIWAANGTLHFFVNDTYQFSLQVTPGLSGGMGVSAEAAGEQAITVLFSDLSVYQPQP